LLLLGARLLDPEGKAPPDGVVSIRMGRIAGIHPPGQRLPHGRSVDLRGAYLAPGFVDLHYHGSLVLRDVAGWEASVRVSAASLVRHGTTAFLVTTVAWSRERLAERVGTLAGLLDAGGFAGAEPLGIHLEGPWIRAEAAGAQPRGAIRPYDPAEGAEALARAEGWLRLVTLAPEVEGARALLAELARRAVPAAVGHSLADAPTLEAAVGEGLRHVTHLFNAMGGFHHRELGVAGFALGDDRLTCDLICDGAHVHPGAVRTAARAKGQRLMLITDAVEPPEEGEGSSHREPGGASEEAPCFDSGPLRSDGVAWRLPDGRLAASRLTLDRAVANFRSFAGADLREAVAACTLRPARLLGIESERGTLRPGARADLVVLDASGGVCEAWIAGNRVYPPS
jgi:N-acetylglucosamine-6-phosphate deacetylase